MIFSSQQNVLCDGIKMDVMGGECRMSEEERINRRVLMGKQKESET